MAAPKKAAKSPKLTAAGRRSLPASDFALPNKKPSVKGAKGDYPIDTPGRARDALSRAATNATPAQKSTVRKNVSKKYPNMKVSQTGKKK